MSIIGRFGLAFRSSPLHVSAGHRAMTSRKICVATADAWASGLRLRLPDLRKAIWRAACVLCVMTSLLAGTQVIFANEFTPFSIKCYVKGSGSESGVDYRLDQDVTYKFENCWLF